jgi:hypothetical protein
MADHTNKTLEWLWVEEPNKSFALEISPEGLVCGCPPYFRYCFGKRVEEVKALHPRASFREYYKKDNGKIKNRRR